MTACSAHAPPGANSSLILGDHGLDSGFSIGPNEFIQQDLLIGRRASPSEPWELLPFFRPRDGFPAPLKKGRFGRFIAASGDKWMIGPLVFKVCTPFPLDSVSAAEDSAYTPVVCGYLEYDNSHSSDPAELLFGVGSTVDVFSKPPIVGFHVQERIGIATNPSADVEVVHGARLFGGTTVAASALVFSVPSKEKRIFPLVVGFYQSGFFYTESRPSLSAVLEFGLQHHDRYVERSDKLDGEFMRSGLGFAEKQILTGELRSWLASTKRLRNDPPVDIAPVCELWRRLGGPQ